MLIFVKITFFGLQYIQKHHHFNVIRFEKATFLDTETENGTNISKIRYQKLSIFFKKRPTFHKKT